jgi:DNA mismatch repair protein MutL
MPVIHVLDEQLANMIAAGEVVDRPANIVKECVENALDAGADEIDIEVFEGGISGVIVTDNGCGMGFEDARLAFERHATSKIQSEEDLFAIGTMGFRGEALPSIASVSKVTLTSAQSEDEPGVRVEIDYGKVITHEVADVPAGTRVEVRGLFEKTPARFKYLKKAAYEFSIIADIVNKTALVHPDIKITLHHDGRLVFQSSGRHDRKGVFYQMFGREVAEKTVPFSNRTADFTITGLAVQPEISRASKQFIYLSINGRLIRSWQMVKAVLEGYKEYLPKERYPIVYLDVEMDPQLVDVNVHPNKWEVRISKEEFLYRLITETIAALFVSELETPSVSAGALASVQNRNAERVQKEEKRKEPERAHQQSLPLDWQSPKTDSLYRQNPQQLYVKEEEPKTDCRIADYTPGNAKNLQNYFESSPQMQAPYANEKSMPIHQKTEKPAEKAEISNRKSGYENQIFSDGNSNQKMEETRYIKDNSQNNPSENPAWNYPSGTEDPKKAQEEKGKEFFYHLSVIGQLLDSYILCQNPQGLVIIDQHAAQERYNFERFSASIDQDVSMVQLMVPSEFTITPAAAARLDDFNECLKPYGLHFEKEDDMKISVCQIPDWMSGLEFHAFLADLTGYLENEQSVDVEKLRRHMIATMACHGSIRFNQKLTKEEMEQVIEDLQKCEQPYHCPHGRPTVITLSEKDLRKEFERG